MLEPEGPFQVLYPNASIWRTGDRSRNLLVGDMVRAPATLFSNLLKFPCKFPCTLQGWAASGRREGPGLHVPRHAVTAGEPVTRRKEGRWQALCCGQGAGAYPTSHYIPPFYRLHPFPQESSGWGIHQDKPSLPPAWKCQSLSLPDVAPSASHRAGSAW